MKPLSHFFRSRSPRPSAAVVLCLLMSLIGSGAGTLQWGGGNIIGDSDVLTNGAAVYAYDWANTNVTVNGVSFTGSASTHGAGTGVGLTASVGTINNGVNYTNANAPYSGLSAGYHGMLLGADYDSTAGSTLTLTLSNLTAGNTYAVQVWVNDPRSNGEGRATTAASAAGNNTVILHNYAQAPGGLGQYAIGTFTAGATPQSFTLTGSGIVQINALQVRDVTGLGYVPPVPGSGQNTNVNVLGPLLFNYAIQTLAGSVNPQPGIISYMPFAGNNNPPPGTNYTATWMYQWTNNGGGLPVVAYYLANTSPNATNVSGAGYVESNSMADTLTWFATNSVAPGIPLNYVMSDDEPYAGSSGNLTTVSNGLIQEIQLIRASGNPLTSQAFVGNYACYPGGSDPLLSGNARIGTDAMYRGLGLTIALPNAYPYPVYTNNGPTWRSGFFWSDLELVSFVQSNLPAGHLDFPWVDSTLNASAPSPTRADNVALLGHIRLRGADGINDLGGMVDRMYGWTDWDWLGRANGVAQVLNLTTSEATGFQWSGLQVGTNYGFLLSNLGTAAAAVSLPAGIGLPATSPTVPPGFHWALAFINDPTNAGGAPIYLGRDDINHGLFVNSTGTLTNTVIAAGPGTNPPAAVTVGVDLAGLFSPGFAGAVILSNNITLQNAGSGVVTFSGPVSGPFALTNAGPGTVVLSGASPFSGGVTVTGGTLQMAGAGALGTGLVTVAKAGTNSGTLQLNLPGVNTVNNAFAGFNSTTFAGAGTIPDIENIAGTNTVTSPLLVTGTGGNGVALEADAGLLVLAGSLSTTLTFRGVELNGAGNGVVTGSITDGPAIPFGLTKDGTGTWTLAGTNAYSGGTTVAAGTLVIYSAQNITGPLTVSNNAALGIWVAGTNQMSASSLTLGTAGGTVTNAFTGLGNTNLAPLKTSSLGLNGTVVVNILGGGFTAGQSYPLIAYGTVSGTGGFTLGSLPPGVAATLGTNGAALVLNVTASVAEVWKGTAGTNWDLGVTTNWSVSGTAAVYGDGAAVQFDDTATTTNVWVAATVLPGQVIFTNSAKNYFVGGGSIAGGGGVTKGGTGTVTLGGVNRYAGPTLVNAGKLVVTTAQTGPGAVTVADHAALGVMVAGAGQLTPAALTLGSAAGPVTNEFTGVASLTAAPVVCGTLTLHGAVTVNIVSGSFLAGQQYPLIAFGSISGTGGFTAGSLPTGVTATVVTNGNVIALNVIAAPYALWKGTAGTNWDAGVTTNWVFNSVPAVFANGEPAVFNDTASTATVWVNGTVNPGGVLVSNNALAYTINGGPITGGGNLVKQGPGVLTLTGANSYSGLTTISGGTLQLANAAGAGTGLITNNAGLTVNISGSNVLGNVVAGPGVFTQASAGTLVLGATNLYTGPTVISAGTLDLGPGGFLGGGYYTGRMTNNAALADNNPGTQTLAGPVTGAGALVQNGPGTLVLAGTNTYSGTTWLNGGTLAATVPGALPAAAVVNFNNATSAMLDLRGAAQTVSSLVFTNLGTLTATVTGTNGSALTVTGPALAVQPYTENVNLTLDLSGLNAFTYANAGGSFTLNNGFTPSSSGAMQTLVNLAGGSNAVVAAGLYVGNQSTSGGVDNSTLNLGGTNVFRVGTIQLGGGRGDGTVQFAAGLTNPVLTITGAGGPGTVANINYGGQDSYNTSDNPVNVFDTSAGTLNAALGALTVGTCGPTANSTGRGVNIQSTFAMGAGTLTASNLTLGSIVNAANAANYTILLGAGFTVTNGGAATITNVVLGNNNLVNPSGSTDTITDSTTVAVGPGSAVYAASVQTGANVSGGTMVSQVLLNGGTLGNIPGAGLTVTNVTLVLNGGTNYVAASAGQTAAFGVPFTGSGVLAVSGPGTTLLTVPAAVAGTVQVNSGTLKLSSGGGLASGAAIVLGTNGGFDGSQVAGGFTLAAGQTLGGSGSVNGAVTAAAGAQIVPGASGTAGGLTFSNALTLNGQSLVFDLSNSTTSGNDQIVVKGGLTVASNVTVYAVPLNGVYGLGTYTLMTYASLSGPGTFISGLGRGATLTVGATNLTLTVTSTNGGANLTWVGDGKTNTWDVQTTTNWLNNGSSAADVFYQGDNVSFTGSGSNSPAINLAAAVQPGSLTVNATQNYTFAGPGQIAGAAGLTKSGAGTLTLATSNTFSGGLIISGGSVALTFTNGTAGLPDLAAGTGLVVANGVLVITNGGGAPVNVLWTNPVTGGGTISLPNNQEVKFSGPGSLSGFTGAVNIPAAATATAKGDVTSANVALNNAIVNVAAGGTFWVNGAGVSVSAPVNGSGLGNGEGYGALRVDGGATVAGAVNLQGSLNVGGSTGGGTISGVVSDGGAGYGLVFGSAGTVTLAGTNTYLGATLVSNGTVNVTGNESGCPGGWLMPNDAATATLNFAAGSVAVVAATNRVQVGYYSASGSSTQTMNVAGMVTNNGSLLVTRVGNFNVLNGGVWVQNGLMTNSPPSGSGYGTYVNIQTGGAFYYNGAGPVVVSPSPANGGTAYFTIGGGTFTTGQGFLNPQGTNSTGAGQIVLTNGGTIVLSANVAQLTTGANSNSTIATLSMGNGGGALNTAGFATTVTNFIGGAGALTKLGAGTLTLAAANTYTGGTTVSAGTLAVNGSLAAGTVVVQTNATLAGSGTVTGPVTVNGTLAPGGTNVATLATGSQTWNAGAGYVWQGNNATNSAGWSGLSVAGGINFASAATNSYVIQLRTLTAGNAPGAMPGFNPAATNTWTVATAAAGFTNFTATAFSVSTAAFSNAFTGTFSVATNGNTLQVVYTPAAVSLTAPVLGTASAYAGGAFSLQFSGVSGQTYHVLETMNLLVPLTNWLVLTNGTFGPGAVNYTNWSATNAAQFYRIKSP